MTLGPEGLTEQAQGFADRLAALLRAVLPDAPDVSAERRGDRVVVSPQSDVPLLVSGERLATLEIHIRCRLDSRGMWLAVEESSYKLSADLDRTPVLRFDYVRDATSTPGAHIQVHAHRGALSHLLSRAGHPDAHDMSHLHVPVGGPRFRPSLEDVLQFLVAECRFDHVRGWRRAIDVGREEWRRIQACAVARDFPQEAAETLRRLGYSVTAPTLEPEASQRALLIW